MMPTIHEISREFGVSLKKLRKMERRGILNCDAENPATAAILYTFRTGNRLTVSQALALLEAPALIETLGNKADKARRQLAELGNVQPAPADVAAELPGAAAGDLDSVRRVLEWCKGAIPPAGEVSHHYLAVRLLMAVPANLRQYEEKRLPRVLLNVRRQDDFAGWWRVAPKGSRGITLYARPGAGFDL